MWCCHDSVFSNDYQDPSGSGRYTAKTSNGTKSNRDSRTVTSDPLNALERGEDDQAAWGRMEQQVRLLLVY